jgi:hypothetical protein
MEMKIMKASLLALALVLAAMVASPAFAKTLHPECAPNYAGKIPPGHEKHGEKFCPDTTPPDAPYVAYVEHDYSTSGYTTLEFSSDATDLDHFVCELYRADGSSRQLIECDENCTSPKSWTGLEVGVYEARFYAVDTSGNVSEPVIGYFGITGP